MSKSLKGDKLKFAFQRKPEPAEAIDICPGIQWFRVPLPFALDHVNCWLLGEPGDQVLIDTGVDNTSTRELWQQVFPGLANKSIDSGSVHGPGRLLVTHFHPDHMGLAGWFAQHNSRLSGSAVEVGLANRLIDTEDDAYSQSYAAWYGGNGLPAETVAVVRANGNTYKKKISVPPSPDHWNMLQDGQTVDLAGQSYQVLMGRGHAPDMIMLFRDADQVLIAADQVLPTISPNVSVMPLLNDKNPLGSFLETLQRLRDLPAETLVLPSHGLPFTGLHQRLDELASHHDMRLAQVLDACSEPMSAYDLFDLMFGRKLDAQQTSFALGESLAHLHYLEAKGQLQRIDDAQLTRFVAN